MGKPNVPYSNCHGIYNEETLVGSNLAGVGDSMLYVYNKAKDVMK